MCHPVGSEANRRRGTTLKLNCTGSYTYDANGNALTDAQGRSFTWDFENRMIQAVVPGNNGGTTTFKYDPFGRRIQKSGPLGTTNYLYDGIRIIEFANASGGVAVAMIIAARVIQECIRSFFIEILPISPSGKFTYNHVNTDWGDLLSGFVDGSFRADANNNSLARGEGRPCTAEGYNDRENRGLQELS